MKIFGEVVLKIPDLGRRSLKDTYFVGCLSEV